MRACSSLHSIHRPIDKDGLRGFHWQEEGYAAIDPQRLKQEKHAMVSEEFKRFDRMIQESTHTTHHQKQKKRKSV